MLHQVGLLLQVALQPRPRYKAPTRAPASDRSKASSFFSPVIHTLTSLLLPVTPSMARLQRRGFRVRCVESVATGGPGYRVCLP